LEVAFAIRAWRHRGKRRLADLQTELIEFADDWLDLLPAMAQAQREVLTPAT
jgi:hypothetical protein